MARRSRRDLAGFFSMWGGAIGSATKKTYRLARPTLKTRVKRLKEAKRRERYYADLRKWKKTHPTRLKRFYGNVKRATAPSIYGRTKKSRIKDLFGWG